MLGGILYIQKATRKIKMNEKDKQKVREAFKPFIMLMKKGFLVRPRDIYTFEKKLELS